MVLLQKAPESVSSIPSSLFTCTPKSHPSPSPASTNTNYSCSNPSMMPVIFRSKAERLAHLQGPHRWLLLTSHHACHVPSTAHCSWETKDLRRICSSSLPAWDSLSASKIQRQCHFSEAFSNSSQFTSPSADFSKHPIPTPVKPAVVLAKLVCLGGYSDSTVLTGGCVAF